MPNVVANNFELKHTLLNMIYQHMFNGLAHEDPNQYLVMFEKFYNMVKINGVNMRPLNLECFLYLWETRLGIG
jgi:hypothetical protein